jgi:hypothetical protein
VVNELCNLLKLNGGAERGRTVDLMTASSVLYFKTLSINIIQGVFVTTW